MLHGYRWHTLLYIYAPKGKSLAQNIDRLFFESNAKLSLEFDRLYSSLFTNAEDCKKIVRLLAQKQQGFTRKEITELTKMPDGGGLSATLKTLEVSDFIASYVKYGYPKREVYYRLTDFYSKFYLSFIDGKRPPILVLARQPAHSCPYGMERVYF